MKEKLVIGAYLMAAVAANITVHGVKLNTWNYSMPEDDFVLEQVSFKALWISAEDESA